MCFLINVLYLSISEGSSRFKLKANNHLAFVRRILRTITVASKLNVHRQNQRLKIVHIIFFHSIYRYRNISPTSYNYLFTTRFLIIFYFRLEESRRTGDRCLDNLKKRKENDKPCTSHPFCCLMRNDQALLF